MDTKLVIILLLITIINARPHEEPKVINSPTIRFIDTDENNRLYLIPRRSNKLKLRNPEVFIVRSDSNFKSDETNVIHHRARQIHFDTKPSIVTKNFLRETVYPYELMTETGLLGVYPKTPSIGIVPAQEIIPVSTRTYVNPNGEEDDPEGLAEVYPGIFNKYKPMNRVPEKLIQYDSKL